MMWDGDPRDLATTNQTGLDLGNHGYAPGIGEEIIVRRTWWERLIDRLIYMPDPFIAEERELILQQARRLKLKTDLQEARIKRRQAVKEQWRPLAVVTLEWRHLDRPAEAHIELSETDTRRRWVLRGMVFEKGGSIPEENKTKSLQFLQSKVEWVTIIDAWVAGSISDDDLSTVTTAKVTMVKPKGE